MSRKCSYEKQNECFAYRVGLVIISICFVVLGFIFFFVVRNGVVVGILRQSLIKQNNRLEIEDGKHDIIITREERPPSELSIDCDTIRLTDLSGKVELADNLLSPDQEAIIEFTVKNNGGHANNVEVSWDKLQVPKGLELTRIGDPIAKLGRYGSQLYKIKVIARGMKAQDIVLDFYPRERTSGSVPKPVDKPPICQFIFTVAE